MLLRSLGWMKEETETPSRLVPWSTLFSSRKYLTVSEGRVPSRTWEVGAVGQRALGSASGVVCVRTVCILLRTVGPWKAHTQLGYQLPPPPHGITPCRVDIPG